MLKEDRSLQALAGAFSASLILSIISLVYVAFLAYGIPGYCKDAESRMMSEFFEDMKTLSAKMKDVVSTGLSAGVNVKEEYPYPIIPFFITPKSALVSSGTYDLTITIENIKSPEVSIPSTLTFKGKGAWATLNLIYTPPVSVYLESGLVFTDKIHLDGSILTGKNIFLPMFTGDSLSSHLSPSSGGGRAITVQNNLNSNITIKILGSKVPENAWLSYSKISGLRVDYDRGNVTIHIPPGQYALKAGLASFISKPETPPPAYLLPEVSTSQRSPAAISVRVLDEFLNPSVGTVRIFCLEPCTIHYIDCSVNQCTSRSATNEARLPSASLISAVVDATHAGITTVGMELNRPTGGPYQLAFLLAE